MVHGLNAQMRLLLCNLLIYAWLLQVLAMERDNADIKRRLDALQLQNTGPTRDRMGPGTSALEALKPQPGFSGGFNVIHMVVLSLIAFFLGKLL